MLFLLELLTNITVTFLTKQGNSHYLILFFKTQSGASLVAQWLRICLPMQGTQVRSLVREDLTCHATEQLSPCATTTEPALYSPCSATSEATTMRSPGTATKSSPHLPQLEKARAQQRRPNTAKNK